MRSLLFFTSLATAGLIVNFLQPSSVSAQVTTDGTTGTTVNADGNNFTIQSGTRNGGNLFHSFQDFSVPTGGEAFFDNALDINNILSRVTGGNISEINGAIRANGGANLFLINPAGIIFGNNASLNIGGSFYGSTADSILFEDGEFSAVNNLNAPILTINAPIGLNLRNNPSSIINRSFASNDTGELVGLEVTGGNTLGLIGGDINFEAGEATASGGQIEIGGLRDAGTVSIESDGSLTFPENVTRANLSFNNTADIDVRGTGGGSISLYANNLEIIGSEFGGSLLRAGIIADSTFPEAQAGDITIDATGDVNLTQGSLIFNRVDPNGVGNAGNININSNSLLLSDLAAFSSDTEGQGNAGNISITANNNIELTSSNIFSQVTPTGEGEGGTITVNTGNLSLLEGSQISAGIFGRGNAGNVTVTASDTITFQGINSGGLPSGIINNVDSNGVGNAGDVEITTVNLDLIDGGAITSDVLGEGDAGSIIVNASDTVNISGFTNFNEQFDRISQISSSLESGATGNAGNINLTSGNLNLAGNTFISSGTNGVGSSGNIFLNISGNTELINSSNIFSQVSSNGEGNGGSITLNTTNLSLLGGSQISSGVFGRGDAGDVTINASETITFQGIDNGGFPSGVVNNIAASGEGNAGNIEVITNNLNLINGGTIASNVFGMGNAGNIVIDAGNEIEISGFATLNEEIAGFSNISSIIGSNVVGNAGNITINGGVLSLFDSAFLNTTLNGQGQAGNIIIDVDGAVNLSSDGDIFNNLGANAIVIEDTIGTVNINASSLSLTDESTSISTSTVGQGNAGDITIEADTFSLSDLAELNSSTFSTGNAGNITLNISNTLEMVNGIIFSNVGAGAQGNGGSVDITANSFFQRDGAQIITSVIENSDTALGGVGNAGNVTINVADNFEIVGSNEDGLRSAIFSDVEMGGVGNAGNIEINAASLTIDNGFLFSSINGNGQPGNIAINVDNAVNLSNGADIFNDVESNAIVTEATRGTVSINASSLSLADDGTSISTSTFGDGDGGNIAIDTSSFSLTNGASIDASTFGIGNGGTILIDATDSISIDGTTPSGEVGSAITSEVGLNALGNGGSIDLTTANLSITNGGFISASTLGAGNGGIISINATDSVSINGISSNSEFSSGIFNIVGDLATGQGGSIDLTTANLSIANGTQINASTFGEGNGGVISINATDSISIDRTALSEGFSTGIFNQVGELATGQGGNISLTTANFSITNGGAINAGTDGEGNAGNVTVNATESISLDGTTFDGEFSSGIGSEAGETALGNGGSIEVTTPNLEITNGAGIFASSEGTGDAGSLTFNIDDRLTLRDNSTISVEASEASGGDITINAPDGFVIAFPNQIDGNGSNITAASGEGAGGNIFIEAQGVLGLEVDGDEENDRINNIDATGEIDGNVEIITPDTDAIEGSAELSASPVEPGQTIAQACSAQRGVANSNLVVMGKGGVPHAPSDALRSEMIVINNQTKQAINPVEQTVTAIDTSKGQIIPAQGVKITESGEIILTAYKNTQDDRIPKIVNCDRS